MEHQITTDNPLLDEVIAHITATGMTKTAFGEQAVSDPRFVFDLENGREPRNRTARRVREFIRSQSEHAAAPMGDGSTDTGEPVLKAAR
jgi:hypothetical protein